MGIFDEIWENGIVSFDTCSLGRMYEWDYVYAVNIKDALSYLLEIKKIWETKVNIQEFSEQRIEIKDSIYTQKYEKGIFTHLKKKPIPWNKINGTLNRWEKKGFPIQFVEEINKLVEKKTITERELNHIIKVSKDFSNKLELENLFDSLFELDNNNLELSEKEIYNLKSRYDSGEVCPGSEDCHKKNGKKYNDLFMWALLKKKAIQEKKDIIFVTADTAKGDWFENNKPRPIYLEEFAKDTGQKIIITSLTKFWEKCKKYLDISVEDFINISSIKDQIEEIFYDPSQTNILDNIEDLLCESNEINDIIAEKIECCVDMLSPEMVYDISIQTIDIEYMDNENVYVTICLYAEICFEAINHTAGEDWSPGSDSVTFSINASAEIPFEWQSEDTMRKTLKEEITINEIIEIVHL